MNDTALSAGRSSYATLSYLIGRDVPALSIRQPIDHGTDAAPKSREAIEDAISLTLAAAVGEMLHLGTDGRHLATDCQEVQRALALAGKLGDGDPVDHLEPIYEDLLACLKSPRIRERRRIPGHGRAQGRFGPRRHRQHRFNHQIRFRQLQIRGALY